MVPDFMMLTVWGGRGTDIIQIITSVKLEAVIDTDIIFQWRDALRVVKGKALGSRKGSSTRKSQRKFPRKWNGTWSQPWLLTSLEHRGESVNPYGQHTAKHCRYMSDKLLLVPNTRVRRRGSRKASQKHHLCCQEGSMPDSDSTLVEAPVGAGSGPSLLGSQPRG